MTIVTIVSSKKYNFTSKDNYERNVYELEWQRHSQNMTVVYLSIFIVRTTNILIMNSALSITK